MKCCVSTDVGTWTNWLTFEPDPDNTPDAGTGLLSPISYKRCNAEFYVGKILRTRIGGMVPLFWLRARCQHSLLTRPSVSLSVCLSRSGIVSYFLQRNGRPRLPKSVVTVGKIEQLLTGEEQGSRGLIKKQKWTWWNFAIFCQIATKSVMSVSFSCKTIIPRNYCLQQRSPLPMSQMVPCREKFSLVTFTVAATAL